MGAAQKLRQDFADRFEPYGDGFVYRGSEGAPGIAVSAGEHADLLRASDARIVTLRWILNAWVAWALLIGALALADRFISPDWAPIVAVLLAAPLLGGVYLWGFGWAGRALRHNPRLDAGLPKAELRRRRLAKLTWWRLVCEPIFIQVLVRQGYAAKNFSPPVRLIFYALAALWLVNWLGDLVGKLRLTRMRGVASEP